MIEYILGFIILLFAGKEIYNHTQKKKLKSEASETKAKLRKEQRKNVTLKEQVAKTAYVADRDKRNGRFTKRTGK